MADLKRAYRALDPAQPAQNVEHYVPRPGDPIGLLGEELKIATSPLHVLVGGQRGVGKTTEMLRLRDRLVADQQMPLMLSVDRDASVKMAKVVWVLLQLTAAAHLPNDADLMAKIDEFGKKNTLATSVSPELKHLSEDVAKRVHGLAQHGVTCLVDGLEKFSPDDAARYVSALVEIPFSFVIVVPVALLLSPAYASVLSQWDRVISVPAITVANPDGNPDAEGRAILRTIVERRAGADAFEESALALIVEASGGIHRELLTLAQQACLRASVAGRVQVREEEARDAVADKRQEVSFHLTPDDLIYLAEVKRHHRVTGDPRALPLIERNLIVGYHSGWSWFDVHPLVKSLRTRF